MKQILFTVSCLIIFNYCFSQSTITDKKYYFCKNLLTAKSMVEIALSKKDDSNMMLNYFISASKYADKAKLLLDSLRPNFKIKLTNKEINDLDSIIVKIIDLVYGGIGGPDEHASENQKIMQMELWCKFSDYRIADLLPKITSK
jgi:hypothetical protein